MVGCSESSELWTCDRVEINDGVLVPLERLGINFKVLDEKFEFLTFNPLRLTMGLGKWDQIIPGIT
jgi:hypothetical protein